MSNLYLLAAGICVTLCIILYVAILRGTKLSLIKGNYGQPKKIVGIVAIVLLVWVIIASILAKLGVFADFVSLPPKMFIVIVVPVTAVLILTFNKKFTQFLKYVPETWLTYLQVFRVPVEIFLWLLFLDGTTPIQMTFEGRNFDILAGLTAPIIAYLYQTNRIGDKALIIWNIASLGLLLNIIGIAIMSFPTIFRVFMNEPSNTAVAHFPLILLPAFLVMIAYTFHIFSLRKLLTKTNEEVL